jgi:Ca2+-binding RTX toxin-like protein
MLDGELDVLHVAVVVLQLVADCFELAVDLGVLFLEFIDVNRSSNTGDDVLTGGADTDTLMGGQGFDTYLFSSGFGNDTILDSDGQGILKYDSVALPGGLKVAGLNGVWEDALRQYVYTLVPNVSGATGGSDLVIGRRTAPGASTVEGTITVKNWQNNQLGINLDASASLPTTPITSVYSGDYIKALKPDGVTYELLNNNYVSAGASPGAADLIGGFAGADRISGGGGNDALIGNAGDDELDGGDGADVLLGGDVQHVRGLVWMAFERGVRAAVTKSHASTMCRPQSRCECVNDGCFWQQVAA